MGPQLGDGAPQVRVPSRRGHARACGGTQLHGHGADAARGRVHEQSLADLEPALGEDGVVGDPDEQLALARLGIGLLAHDDRAVDDGASGGTS